MGGGASTGLRWAGWIGLAAALGLAAAIWFDRSEPLAERVLSWAPDDASIVAYTELEPLRESEMLGRLVHERLLESAELSIVERELDAIAVAVGSDEIVGLAAGSFPVSLVQRHLESSGAICPAALDEQACSMPAGKRGGYLSIRALDSGLIGLTNGPRPTAAAGLVATGSNSDAWAAEALGALESGALVWISIEPRKLAETMSNPPEGWINLSLVARALLPAQTASVTLRDDREKSGIDAKLEAVCGSAADATELAKVLESLNKLAATALRSGSSEESHAWARALDEGFSSEGHAQAVTARWRLPEALVAKWLDAER
jgi:hypothetical protein